MSLTIDEQQDRQDHFFHRWQENFFSGLVIGGIVIAVLLMLFELVQIAYQKLWIPYTEGKFFAKTVSLKTDDVIEDQKLVNDWSQFENLLKQSRQNVGAGNRIPDLELLSSSEASESATLAAAAAIKNGWGLEIKIDGQWQPVKSFVKLPNLLVAEPVVWQNKLVFLTQNQDGIAAINAFHLINQTESELLNFEQAKELVAAAGENFTPELEKMDIVRTLDGALLVYLSNVFDDGIVLYNAGAMGENGGNQGWKIWSKNSGQLVMIGNYDFLLDGYTENCQKVYTLGRWDIGDRLKELLASGKESEALTSQTTKVATIFGGCSEGWRYLGVDKQGRLLVGDVQGTSASTGTDLDVNGVYTDLYAIPVLSPAERVRLLWAEEMPSGIGQVGYFPSIDGSEYLILVSESKVYAWNMNSGEMREIADLFGQFGVPAVRSYDNETETLCLEMTERTYLPLAERLISLNWEVGGAVSGAKTCLAHEAQDMVYTRKIWDQNEKIAEVLAGLELPDDYRLAKSSGNEEVEE